MDRQQIERLVEAETYWSHRQNVFPNLAAYLKFKRTHNARLHAKRALYLISGRELVDPILFDQVVLDIGHRQAQAGL